MYKLVILLFLFIVGCATGEKISSVEEGMSKEQVRSIMGSQDRIIQKNGATIYIYENRLMSGWSWDKTDYYIIFDDLDKVSSVDRGEVDTSTSERMQDMAEARRQEHLRERELQRIRDSQRTKTTCIKKFNGVIECETNPN